MYGDKMKSNLEKWWSALEACIGGLLLDSSRHGIIIASSVGTWKLGWQDVETSGTGCSM